MKKFEFKYLNTQILAAFAILALLSLGALSSEAAAQGSFARICNESGAVFHFIQTDAEGRMVRDPAPQSLHHGTQGRARLVVTRKANGWFTVEPGSCVGTSTGALVDPAWHAFIDDDGRPLVFTPQRSVTYENKPDYLCYVTWGNVDAWRALEERRSLFGMDLGSSYYVTQTDECASPDHTLYRVSFGVLATGNVDYTITLR